VAGPDLWYTVINEREISPAWEDSVLAALKF